MTEVAYEYERYQASSIMKRLAAIAHGENYREQTSSATYDEIACLVEKMALPPESLVLDAGCGNGAFSLPLAESFPLQVKGIDLSQTLIEEAGAKAAKANLTSKCSFSVGDFTALPSYSTASFDLVICIGSLYWGQSLATTLAAWHRITRSNGWLLLFLNLLYKPLDSNEKSAIGVTQFVPALSLAEELAKSGWVISEWSDGTDQYITWLQRWCSAMEEMTDNIVAEMGEEAASQLIRRFMTYYSLAQRNAVRRIILRAEHV
jgi:cyclopropane fatty-acyl-phospholipid synthase-like methyltransferase